MDIRKILVYQENDSKYNFIKNKLKEKKNKAKDINITCQCYTLLSKIIKCSQCINNKNIKSISNLLNNF